MAKIMIKISDDDYESIKRGMRYKDIIADIMQQIENAEPVLSSSEKPKMGHWIVTYEKDEVYSNVCICSECSHSDIGSGNYCRWCGAKMLPEAEE